MRKKFLFNEQHVDTVTSFSNLNFFGGDGVIIRPGTALSTARNLVENSEDEGYQNAKDFCELYASIHTNAFENPKYRSFSLPALNRHGEFYGDLCEKLQLKDIRKEKVIEAPEGKLNRSPFKNTLLTES